MMLREAASTYPAAAARSLVPNLADSWAIGPLSTSVECVWDLNGGNLLDWHLRIVALPHAHLVANDVHVDSLESLVHSSFPCRLHRVDAIYYVLLLKQFGVGKRSKQYYGQDRQLSHLFARYDRASWKRKRTGT